MMNWRPEFIGLRIGQFDRYDMCIDTFWSISDKSYDTLQVDVLLKRVNAFQILILIMGIDISCNPSAFVFFVIYFVPNCDPSWWMYADQEGKFIIFLSRLGISVPPGI